MRLMVYFELALISLFSITTFAQGNSRVYFTPSMEAMRHGVVQGHSGLSGHTFSAYVTATIPSELCSTVWELADKMSAASANLFGSAEYLCYPIYDQPGMSSFGFEAILEPKDEEAIVDMQKFIEDFQDVSVGQATVHFVQIKELIVDWMYVALLRTASENKVIDVLTENGSIYPNFYRVFETQWTEKLDLIATNDLTPLFTYLESHLPLEDVKQWKLGLKSANSIYIPYAMKARLGDGNDLKLKNFTKSGPASDCKGPCISPE